MEKSRFQYFFAILFATSLFVAPTAFSAESTDSPYSEGTGLRRLTPEEKASLAEYAENSRVLLNDALERAHGQGFEEANRIYLGAIKKVVIASYQAKPRTELLLRHALNQAMELTFGVPGADGRTIVTPGVLVNSINSDLMTLILEDSIRLAIQFYNDDRKAIDAGSLVNLPYVQFASQRLALAQKWLTSITEWNYMYTFSVTALQQWLNTVMGVDDLSRAAYAEEIVKIDQSLQDLSGSAPKDDTELKQRVRFLRGLIRRTLVSLSQKLQLQLQIPQESAPVPTVPAQSEGPIATGARVMTVTGGTYYLGTVVAVYDNDTLDVRDDSDSQVYNRKRTDVSPAVSSIGGFTENDEAAIVFDNGSYYMGKILSVYSNGYVVMRDYDDSRAYSRKASTLLHEVSSVGAFNIGDEVLSQGTYRGKIVQCFKSDGVEYLLIRDADDDKYYMRKPSTVSRKVG